MNTNNTVYVEVTLSVEPQLQKAQVPVRGDLVGGHSFFAKYPRRPVPDVPVVELGCKIVKINEGQWGLYSFVIGHVIVAGNHKQFVGELTYMAVGRDHQWKMAHLVATFICEALGVDEAGMALFTHPVAAGHPTKAMWNKHLMQEKGYDVSISWKNGRPFITLENDSKLIELRHVIDALGCPQEVFNAYVFTEAEVWYERTAELKREALQKAQRASCTAFVHEPEAGCFEFHVAAPDSTLYVLGLGESLPELLSNVWVTLDVFLDHYRGTDQQLFVPKYEVTAERLVSSWGGLKRSWEELSAFVAYGHEWEAILGNIVHRFRNHKEPMRLTVRCRTNAVLPGDGQVARYDDVFCVIPMEIAEAIATQLDSGHREVLAANPLFISWLEPLLVLPGAKFNVTGIKVYQGASDDGDEKPFLTTQKFVHFKVPWIEA